MSHPTFGLHLDSWGRLVLVDGEGQRYIGVEPVRCFPISDPDRWISIVDSSGREIICIEDIEQLPPVVRQVLRDDLSRREFLPILKRVDAVITDGDRSTWTVETDRGRTTFVLKSGDDVRPLDARRLMIVDAQGVRYFIPNVHALDRTSRHYIEEFS